MHFMKKQLHNRFLYQPKPVNINGNLQDMAMTKKYAVCMLFNRTYNSPVVLNVLIKM